MPFFKDPTPQFDYNIEKAKEHLAKAGLKTLDVDLSVSEAAFPGATESAVLYKEHAAKAGININIIREADDGYWENVWLKKPFNGCDWYGRATCDWLFSTAYAADASWNNTHWNNPRFNELLVAARSETDNDKRAAQYGEMQQLLHDDGGVITVAFAYTLWAWGLTGLRSTTVTTLTLAEPMGATLLGLFVLGERLDGAAATGIALIALGLVIVAARGTVSEPSPKPARRP